MENEETMPSAACTDPRQAENLQITTNASQIGGFSHPGSAWEESFVSRADRGPEACCFGGVEIETVSQGRDELVCGVQQLLVDTRRMNGLQNAAAQGEVHIGCAALDDKILDERGSRIGLEELAFPREQRFVGRRDAEIEAEGVASAVRNLSKSPVAVVQLGELETVRAIFALRCYQRQRLDEASSESDVDEVTLIEANQQAQVIA